MLAYLSPPVRVLVADAPAQRLAPPQTGDEVVDALATHMQRLACRAALTALCGTVIGRDWLVEGELPEADWRACMAPDARRLLTALERRGVMEFVHG